MKSYIKAIVQNLSILFFQIRNPKIKILAKECLFINNKVSIKTSTGGGISVGKDTSLRNCKFIFWGKNNIIKIGRNCRLNDTTFWFEDDNNEIIIGDDVTIGGAVQLAACESTCIKIGNDCMFSHDIYIRTTDSHPIYNENGKRINSAASILISNHVWIGMQSILLKGASIPTGAIIAARSLVNKVFNTENAIYAGHPAKLVKEGMRWERERKQHKSNVS